MNQSRTALRASAVVFAAGYFVAMFLPTLPEGAYSDDRVSALLAEPAERTPILIGGYALTMAAVAFLILTVLLTRRPVGEQTALTRTVRVAGGAYAAMLMLGAVLFASVPMGVTLGELRADLDPTVFRVMSNAGFYALLVPGLLAAAVVLVGCSLAMRRTVGVPRWCAVLGFVLAPLLLLGAAWVPQFLVPLWAVAVAFGMRGNSSTMTGAAGDARLAPSSTAEALPSR